MENPRNPIITGFYAVIHIGITMVIVHCQTKHPRLSSIKSFCQLLIPQKRIHRISGMFDLKSSRRGNRINAQFSITGTPKHLFFRGKAALSLFQLSGKKIIIRSKCLFFPLGGRKPVSFHKARNHTAGQTGI